MNLSRMLTIAGVPATLHAEVIDCIDFADDQSDGLLLAKGRFLREAPNAPSDRWTKYGSFNLTASF